ncbi:uncharacterized protein STEHIDRAFT_120832 [Stereum hirsutum FP-91666 SS1]|uniref:uncharacterized protein n=1 Tax=Stereum hirsutum (strain FP-91666) TaxID=721885 RepID=UPI000440F132|nr:uncharacterized protein STEHIDRAFT_120832 [Stereum hirsutum FP-91666 SS1]EIM87084.1 hypothetical protein STEHIDRAFT_120832 [Stereum hirsutum FP-91666 SS1]
MESKSAQTYEALQAFIQSQKTLLARTQSDIQRLRGLRADANAANSNSELEGFVENLDDKLCEGEGVLELSEQLNVADTITKDIDWPLFKTFDPTPLHTLTTTLNAAHAAHSSQPLFPPSDFDSDVTSHLQPNRFPLSPLQLFVREARVKILDPVLNSPLLLSALQQSPSDDESSSSLSSSSSDEDEDVDEEARERRRAERAERRRIREERRTKEQERAKIRELRKRRIGEGGLTLPKASRLGAAGRQGGEESGVFVRRDLEDESAEVDISMNGLAVSGGSGSGVASSSSKGVAVASNITKGSRTSGRRVTLKVKQETSPASVPSKSKFKSSTTSKRRPSSPLPQHDTRPSKRSKVKASTTIISSLSMSAPTPTSALGDSDASDGEVEQDDDGDEMMVAGSEKSKTKNGKPRNETYKQAWSVEEQHLLERLLQEIPDGEKNRWSKISKAMNGRRTPRQVASRVQKYFEKLKRFGVDLKANGAGTALVPMD